MPEDEAYRLLQQDEDDVGEDPDLPMITSPFLHRQDGNANGDARWSRTSSGWRGRASEGRLLGSARAILCPTTARTVLSLGLLTLMLGVTFWTTRTPALPPVVEDSIFKVSFARFQTYGYTNAYLCRRC